MNSTSDRTYLRLTISLVTMFLLCSQLGHAQGAETATLAGKVLDEKNKPIQNAIICVLGPRYRRSQATTNSSGSFQVVVDREGWYSVYAICNLSETPGVDYVPSLWQTYLQLGSIASFTFALEKGASVYLEEELRFVESSRPADSCTFTITRPNGDPLGGKYSVYTYGSDTDLSRRFGLNPKLAIVPADTEVIIKASAQVLSLSHTFFIEGKMGYLKVPQGERLHLDIREPILEYNAANLKQTLDEAFYLHKDAEDVGYLVTLEREDLLDAYGLIEASFSSMRRGLFDESFASLRSAYILISQTSDSLRGLMQIGYQSAFVLSLLFVFIASAAAYLVTERESSLEMLVRGRKGLSFSLNLLIAVVFYAVLFSFFYFSYPGCRLIPTATLFSTAFLALVLGQLVVARSPRTLAEKTSEDRSIQFRSAVIIAFSMACRNLRRRRLRTVLTLLSTMILILGFVSFTSISPGYGLIMRPLHSAIPIDALLIKDLSVSQMSHFNPLSPSIMNWLESQPNVTRATPKAENIPPTTDAIIGYLYSESEAKLTVQGIVGIQPSAEAEFTHINNIITDGGYLQEDDHRGILISSALREELDVGDSLYGFKREFIIRGFFDPSALEELPDVDGQPFIPRFVDTSSPYPILLPCRGDWTIIITYNTALTLPQIAISRVNVQLKDPDTKEYSDFAQMVALTMEYEAYVSHPNSLHIVYLGGYVEEKGVGSLPYLLFLVVMNISASMLGSVKERRDEISSLSSVGLNPTHIAALFMAEATVIGFIGGGLGYLLGISAYRLAASPFFGALQVREKASAEWGLIALLVSGFASILASMIPALQASTIVTPSLLRKWRLEEEEKPSEVGEPWTIDLPTKLMPREIEPFTMFVLQRMRERESGTAGYVTNIKLEEEAGDGGPLKRVSFRYYPQAAASSDNQLVIQRSEGDHLDIRLLCLPLEYRHERGTVRDTATYVRELILQWKSVTFDVATPYDPSLTQLYTLASIYNPTSLYIVATQPIPDEKMDLLKKKLIIEGLRPPRIVVSLVNRLDIEQCMETAEDLASRADVVCISGEPDALCTALAVKAKTQRKTICFVVDPRPTEVRKRNPFEVLKIVNVKALAST